MLYALVPGALAWTAQFDRGFGLITVLGLYGCERMIESKKSSETIVWPLFTGLVYSIATFMSIGNLPIILIGALYMSSRVWQQERLAQWRWRLLQASLVLLGIASVWLLCLPTGFDLIGMLRATLSTHLDLERPFWPFVLWHAWDIITFIGIPFVALGLLGLRQRQQPHVFALALSCFVTLLILCLAHVARGETGRVWMFFAPLPVAITALLCFQGNAISRNPTCHPERSEGPRSDIMRPFATLRVTDVAALLILLVVQASTQIGWLRFIGYGIDPATVLNVSVPATITPTNIRYGRSGEVRLLGFEAQPALKAGDYSDVTLYWQLDSTQPLTRSYKVFVHYTPNLDNTERIVNQDSIPMNWTLPTPCWRPGQVVRDQHGIRIDPAAKPGNYLALVGLYEETSGEREYVHTAQQAKDFAVALPVKISVSD